MSPTTSPENEPAETLISEIEIERAVARGAHNYFEACRRDIPGFVDRHFRYPGVIATNRVALGWDIARAPLNLLWAPVYATVSIIKFLARSGRGQKYSDFLAGIPAGFTTRVQRHIASLIKQELLQYGQAGKSLNDYIVQSLEEVYQCRTKTGIDHQRFQTLIAPILADSLIQYQVTRTAAADIGNALSCTVLGAFAFKKFTPGGIGVALVLASMLAETLAARDFILARRWAGCITAGFRHSRRLLCPRVQFYRL